MMETEIKKMTAGDISKLWMALQKLINKGVVIKITAMTITKDKAEVTVTLKKEL